MDNNELAKKVLVLWEYLEKEHPFKYNVGDIIDLELSTEHGNTKTTQGIIQSICRNEKAIPIYNIFVGGIEDKYLPNNGSRVFAFEEMESIWLWVTEIGSHEFSGHELTLKVKEK